jgi:hypothetical protein
MTDIAVVYWRLVFWLFLGNYKLYSGKEPPPPPTFQCDADPEPDPSFQINAQNLEKIP